MRAQGSFSGSSFDQAQDRGPLLLFEVEPLVTNRPAGLVVSTAASRSTSWWVHKGPSEAPWQPRRRHLPPTSFMAHSRKPPAALPLSDVIALNIQGNRGSGGNVARSGRPSMRDPCNYRNSPRILANRTGCRCRKPACGRFLLCYRAQARFLQMQSSGSFPSVFSCKEAWDQSAAIGYIRVRTNRAAAGHRRRLADSAAVPAGAHAGWSAVSLRRRAWSETSADPRAYWCWLRLCRPGRSCRESGRRGPLAVSAARKQVRPFPA